MKITIDTKYTKTYKTEKNLDKAVEKMNLPDDVRWILVKADNDKYTAVFVNSGIYMSMIAHNGFKVLG